ncbi:hypothetical protein PACTADRAFT_50724 [Pachysolen tannophilus NRRL Y-2460]|uniref:Protein yippee-like n=1 Tax=Pachysolen tannophilus NRRL Y-2460 TaxID=669874 RepID=A0A1E4TSZ6_PACTA|nr:hypothetical protein PACTADRAFT_50724 [Pachysolen tannophilus NRRL Y-2460]
MGLRYSEFFDTDEDDNRSSNSLFSKSARSSISSFNSSFSSLSSFSSASCLVNGKSSSTKLCTYGCRSCLTHLSVSSLIISDGYRGRTGDAYLVKDVVNVILGEPNVRTMITGRYVACDIKCHQCHRYIGWKYLKSEDKNQKFKEGKYIIELDTLTNVR